MPKGIYIRTNENKKNIGESRKKLIEEGKITVWNKGLTKETNDSVNYPRTSSGVSLPRGFMNKKAQGYFYFFMIGVIIFLITFGLASSLIKNSDKVRVDMDCGNTSISTTEKISCTTVDLVAPFVLAILLGVAGMVLLAKVSGG